MQVAYELRDVHRAVLMAVANSPALPLRDEILLKAVAVLLGAQHGSTALLHSAFRYDSSVRYPPDEIYAAAQRNKPLLTKEVLIAAIGVLDALGLIKSETKFESSYTPPPPNAKRGAKGTMETHPYYDVTTTPDGVRVAEALEEGRAVMLRAPLLQRTTVFVASAFGHEDLDRLFDHEISPACDARGLQAFRVDRAEPQQTITAEIIRAIAGSRCVIGDLTYGRPSVYFELGVAHGLGIPLVLTCRRDHFRANNNFERVHFDLEQYKISYWSLTDKKEFAWEPRMHPSDRLTALGLLPRGHLSK